MVQSKADTVDEFIAQADPARAPYLAKIRDAARRHLTGFVEDMRYGMPTYTRGEAGFAFNSQKQYIALYVPPAAHALNAEALAGVDCGKSCIRFRKPAAIDSDLVERLLRDTAALDASIC